jgi:hypothetical protein
MEDEMTWEEEYNTERLTQLAKLQKRFPDLSKMKLLYQSSDRASYFINETDNGDSVTERQLYIVYHGKTEYCRSILTSRHQKFLCVNGPNEGKKFELKAGEEKGYRLYNNSSRPYRRSEVKTPTAVLVWFGRTK